MANTEDFISLLDGVKRTGPRRWLARCPAHEDKSPSLSIREASDGRTLITCFAGCDAGAVVGAVGLTLRDLFPAGSAQAAHGSRSPVPVGDVLGAVEVDLLTVSIITTDLMKKDVISLDEKMKLTDSVGRILAAIEFGRERRYDPKYRQS